LRIVDGNFSISSENNLYFGYGTANVFMPEGINQSFERLVQYLNEEKNKHLDLKGMFSRVENGDDELGLARAETIRSVLIRMGIDTNQISTSFIQNDNLIFDNENARTYAAIEFAINDLPEDSKKPVEMESNGLTESLSNPPVIYFESASISITDTPQFQLFITDLSAYLEKFPDQKVSVIGHTDWDGSNEFNKQLSNRRSKAVKSYMVSKGISGSNIELDGRGSDEPVADNNTEQGKAKNRRVEMKLI
jgi:outer membrane protein OmpA-like peptidoglycan-associated protein